MTNYSQAQIVDSRMSDTLGFAAELALIEAKIGPLADSIREGLRPLVVQYYGFDEEGNADLTLLREGVLMVHESVEEDLKHIFLELQQIGFPIEKVVPSNKYGLNRDTTGWNDSHSMEDNNTSAFNYRYITNSDRLSPHGMGIAIDFNPHFNPFESYHHDGKFVEPHDAHYEQNRLGTISDSVVVGLFDKRGWIWGGRWNNPVDYQHFDKRSRSRKHYMMKESALKDYFQYGDGDGSIALFAEPYYKKKKQPEVYLYKEEKDTFLYYADYLNAKELYHIFRKKGKQKWADFKVKEAALFSGLEQRIMNAKRKKGAQSLQNNLLKGCKISVVSRDYAVESKFYRLKQWNQILANELESILRNSGAQITHPSDADISLIIDLGNPNMFAAKAAKQTDNYQLLVVPGAYKEKNMAEAEDRICFLHALLSDQLPESLRLAKCLQKEIEQECGLKPVSRQLPGPNLLESDYIKTDEDGIYCGYYGNFGSIRKAEVVIAPYSVYHPKVAKWLEDGQMPSEEFKQLLEACRKGLLEYFRE
jgi:hypothetical protein